MSWWESQRFIYEEISYRQFRIIILILIIFIAFFILFESPQFSLHLIIHFSFIHGVRFFCCSTRLRSK